MAETASLSLAQMVDLALGTPEVGAVNFNVLHTLLHAVLQKLDIANVKTDVDAADTDFLAQQRPESRIEKDNKKEGDDEGKSKTDDKGADSDGQSPKDSSSSGLSPAARDKRAPYHQLQDRVNQLEKRLEDLNELPSNSELYDRSKAAQGGDSDRLSRPVADMWQNMQLSRKVGANEEGVDKLMSLTQDLMNEMQKLKKANDELKKQLEKANDKSDLLDKLKELEDRLNDLNKKVGEMPKEIPEQKPFQIDEDYFVTWPALEESLRGMRQDLARPEPEPLQPQPQVVIIEKSSQTEIHSRPASRISTPGPSAELVDLLEKLGKLTDRHDILEERVDSIEEQLKSKADKDALDGLSVPDDLLRQLKEMQEMLDKLRKDKDQDKTALEEQLAQLRSFVEALEGRIQLLRNELERTLHSLEEQIQDLREIAVNEVKAEEVVQEEDTLGRRSEDTLGRRSSEMMGMNKKLKLLTQDLNREMRETRERLGGLEGEVQQLIGVLDDLKRTCVTSDNDVEGDALHRMKQSLLQLQSELERLSDVTQKLMDDSGNKQKQIDTLFSISNKLEENKADKDFVQQEVDVKADKRHLDSKVNRTMFDTTCDELNKMINDILGKLSGHEEDWKKALALMNDDLDGKLDRLEFGPIRDELERQLKMLMRKLNQMHFPPDYDSDDAAGIRKQMVQRFNCISCDRPVEMAPQGPIPSIPASAGLPSTRSARPYTTFELEQIRQHAKSGCAGRNLTNFERAILERQVARCRVQADFRAYLVHFGKDMISGKRSKRRNVPGPQPHIDVMDLYATSRACGGSHTLTYPNRRITRMGTINALFKEEEIVPPKDELDIQGADGHVYKGHMTPRGTKLPDIPNNESSNKSPKLFRKVHHPDGQSEVIPNAPLSPRPSSAQIQRPGGVSTPRPHSALGRGQRTPPPSTTDIPTGDDRGVDTPVVPPAPAPSEPDGEQLETTSPTEDKQ